MSMEREGQAGSVHGKDHREQGGQQNSAGETDGVKDRAPVPAGEPGQANGQEDPQASAAGIGDEVGDIRAANGEEKLQQFKEQAGTDDGQNLLKQRLFLPQNMEEQAIGNKGQQILDHFPHTDGPIDDHRVGKGDEVDGSEMR